VTALARAQDLDVALRPACADDRNYVMATWLRSYVDSMPRSVTLPRRLLWTEHDRALKQILARPAARVLIAHPVGEDSIILGWLCAEGDVVHYVYTRDGCRRQGIAARMAAHVRGAVWLSHLTPDGRRIQHLFQGAVHNPYRMLLP
jgi:GNAT superfamily N-acetyltransferase